VFSRKTVWEVLQKGLNAFNFNNSLSKGRKVFRTLGLACNILWGGPGATVDEALFILKG